MNKKSIVTILLFSLALKVIYFLFALGVSATDTGFHTDATSGEFFYVFKRNDSGWYQKAAEEGYPKITNPLDLGYSFGPYFKQSVWALFPFYPLSVHAVMSLTGLAFDQSAFLLSLLFSSLCFVTFYMLCLRVFDMEDKKSLICTLFFMCFPFHYFFSMFYTEAMFFSFLALSFLGIATKKFWVTGLSLIPLVLLRPNGIVCLLPLALYAVEQDGGFRRLYQSFRSQSWKDLGKYAWFLSAPLAFAAYCIYQKELTDTYFAFVKAQAGWYKTTMFPLLALFRRSDTASQFNSYYTLLILVLSLFAWKKFPLSLNVFTWLMILLPLSSGSVISMPRYITIIFPLCIFMFSAMAASRLKYYFLGLAFLLQLLTFYPWLLSDPLSY